MTYPLTINPPAAPPSFPVPPPVAVVGACPISANRCGITTLSLQGHPHGGGSLIADPVALAPGAGERFIVAPLVETFTLQWDLAGHAFIEILRLELYRHGNALPIWTKTLDYTANVIGAHGSTQFDGDLNVGVHGASIPASAVNVAFPAAGAAFPRSVLTAEHAPYKLLLRVVRVAPNTEVEVPLRFIYLDVMVHDIRLALGPAAWIPAVAPLGLAPPAAAQAIHYRLTRARTLTVATRLALAGDLAGGVDELSTGALATLRVRQTSNTFSKREGDFYSNTVFSALHERWGDGPTLPLVATLRIRQSDGNPAPHAAGAPALGTLALMWDWESGAAPAMHPQTQEFLTAARDYEPTLWPHAAGNCHHDHGGKRGAPGNLHFADLPVGSIGAGAPAAVPAPPPPPPAHRPWCHYSRAVTDAANADAGTSGVLFIPSRMAGDSYKLRVHLAYPTPATFDHADINGVLADSIHVDSPHTLQVWRRVEVARQLHKDPASADAPNLVWAAVLAIYEAACVELRAPAGNAPIPAPQFRAACATVFPSLPPGPRLALLPAAGQDNGIFGLNFDTYANYRVAVDGYIVAMQGLVAPAQATDNQYLVAQLQNIYGAVPPSYASNDLLIPTRADHASASNVVRDLVLANLGITDQASYDDCVKGWADDLIQTICGEHARAQNPGIYGIHLYHFEFLDALHQQGAVAYASTTVSNFVNCPACNAATTAVPPVRGFVDTHKICGTCGLRLDESANVTSIAPFRYMNGVNDAWSRANLPRRDVLKIAVGGQFGTTAAISIAHEIGHQLGMPHAGPEPIPLGSMTGGKYPPFHDHDDLACIMSYNFRRAPDLHFCGLCCLRIAGWSMGPSALGTPENALDGATVELSNHAEFNQAQAPIPPAAYQVNPVQCTTPGCGRAFGLLRSARHCGLCGQAFCSDHASHRRPVRDPLVANPVANVRVCDTCNGLGANAPAVGAIWEPDENATVCADPGCATRFSARQRRHHCRACGKIVCNTHSGHQRNINRPLSEDGPVSMERVCGPCNARYG